MNRSLPNYLKFKESYVIATIDESKIQIRNGELDIISLSGKNISYLVPIILMLSDGTKPISQVIRHCRKLAPKEIVEKCITKLYDARILVEEPDSKQDEKKVIESNYSFMRNISKNSTLLLKRVSSAKIGIISQTDLSNGIISSLRKYGFEQFRVFEIRDKITKTEDTTKKSKSQTEMVFDLPDLDEELAGLDLIVILISSLDAYLLDALNNICVTKSIPFLPVDIFGGPYCSIGPLVTPGSGPCYECFRSRLRSNIGKLADIYDEFLSFQKYAKIKVNPYKGFPIAFEIACGISALEVFKFISEIQVPASIGYNIVFDFMNNTLSRDRVLQVPRCISCSQSQKSPTGHWQV